MKTPEQEIAAEMIVITRLRVTDESGVKRKKSCGFTDRANAAIPIATGMRLRSFSVPLLVDRNSVTPAIQNATRGNKASIIANSFISLLHKSMGRSAALLQLSRKQPRTAHT